MRVIWLGCWPEVERSVDFRFVILRRRRYLPHVRKFKSARLRLAIEVEESLCTTLASLS